MKRYIRSDVFDLSNEDAETRKDIAVKTAREHNMYELSEDPDEVVRQYLAHNKNLPEDLIVKLASDYSAKVREAIAEHPNLPHDLLLKFSEDPLPLIRLSTLYNPNVTQDIVEKLLTDGDYRVEDMAKHVMSKLTGLDN